MKKMRRFFALLIAMIMVLGMMSTAFAAKGDSISVTKGTITVKNAAKGETYKIYKIFDATISKVEGEGGTADSVAYIYTGTLPSTLANAFEKIDGTDYVKVIDGKSDDDVITAVKAYMATLDESEAVASKVADGTPVVFDSLDFGYYGVTTSLGAAVTIDSANPDATIFDKNPIIPTAEKTVEHTSYSIGDTVKYTGTFDTTNFLGEGADSKQVTKYKVSDTLPAFLSDVKITSVKILNKDGTATIEDLTSKYSAGGFGDDKTIFIQWSSYDAATATWTSLYPQGAIIEIKYEATLTDVTNIGENDTNTITIRPYVEAPEGDDDDDDDDDDDKPWDEEWHKDQVIKTYAAALKKVDGSASGAAGLAGAKFKFAGLKATKGEDGVYTVTEYDPQGSLDDATELEVDAQGMLYIVGLAADVTLTGEETEAPNGYNKLTGSVELSPQVMDIAIYKKDGYRKYDGKGNIIEESETEKQDYVQVTKNLSELDAAAVKVINEKGTELPSTGGIGTTIFYVIGAILVLGSGVLLVTRRRVNAN